MWVVGVIVTLWSALLTSTGVEAARMPAFVHAGVGTADIGRHVADSVVFTPTAISSVSCTSAGNCSAGGSADSSGAVAAPLVVDQEHGIWDRARGLPLDQGLRKLARTVEEWRAPQPPHDDISVAAVELV